MKIRFVFLIISLLPVLSCTFLASLGRQRPVTVSITSLTNNQEVATNFSVAGTAAAGGTISAVTIYAQTTGGGAVIQSSAALSGPGTNMNFSAALDVPGFGYYNIWAVAVDSRNSNSASSTIPVTVTDIPILDFSTPAGDGVFTMTNSLAVTVSGSSSFFLYPVTNVTVIQSVSGSGIAFTNAAAGTNSWIFNALLTNGATNAFSAYAVDCRGRRSQTRGITVYALTNVPIVAFTAPANDQVLSNESILVAGTVSDAAGVASVFLSQNGGAFFPTAPGASWGTSLACYYALTNYFQAYAVNILGTVSATNNVTNIRTYQNWACATNNARFAARYGQSCVVFNNAIWAICGCTIYSLTNDVWYSSDGTNWSYAANMPTTGRERHASVVFNSAIWVIGGWDGGAYQTNDVWYSSDGTNWHCATNKASFSGRMEHSAAVFNSMIWVIGGYDNVTSTVTNDVWYSPDGTNWHCATNKAPFAARTGHACVVFNNEMWVIAGDTNASNFNDVWHSPDGTNWSLATNNAGFIARWDFGYSVYKNRIWVIGGILNGTTATNDVWYTSNGTNWFCANSSPAFNQRYLLSSAVFNNHLWMIAGVNVASIGTNDVWYSQ